MSYQALLFCPDEKTARIVTQVLGDLEFSVEPCTEPFAAVKKLMAQHYDALVVDCDNEQNATLLFKSARNSGSNQNSLAVAVVEGQAGVARAFRIGANLVLTKPINVEQSKGTLRVARGLLRKADAGKSGAAGAAPTLAPAVEKPVLRAAAIPPAPSASPVKPAIAPSPALSPVASPLASPVPPASWPKPAFAPAHNSIQASMASGPSASASFEVDAEITPKPEAAEAALLESLPELSDKRPGASGSSKEYAWQPVSKPLSEPVASALRRATEAAGKTSESFPGARPGNASSLAGSALPGSVLPGSAQPGSAQPGSAQPGSAQPGSASLASPLASSQSQASQFGSAAAAAPAKEAFKPSPAESQIVLPEELLKLESGSSSLVDDEAAFEAEASKLSVPAAPAFEPLASAAPRRGTSKYLVIAAAIVIASAAGYLGWSKMHSAAEPSAAEPSAASSSPSPSTSTSASAPAAVAPSSTDNTADNTAAQGAATSSASPAPGKSPLGSGTDVASPSAPASSTVPKPSRAPAKSGDSQAIARGAEPSAPIMAQDNPSSPAITVSNAPAHKVLTVAKSPVAQTPQAIEPPPAAALATGASSTDAALSGIVVAAVNHIPAATSDGPLRISQGVTQGLLIRKVAPIYPQQALQLHMQGTVQLQANISKEGKISNVKTLNGDAILARAAVDAVRQWKYKPYMLNGEAVGIQTEITVNFKLPNL